MLRTRNKITDYLMILAWASPVCFRRKTLMFTNTAPDAKKRKKTNQDKTRQVYSANTMSGHQHTEVSTHTCTHQTHLTT